MGTVRATIVQAPTPDGFDVLRDQLMTFDERGLIESVHDAGDTTAADVELGAEWVDTAAALWMATAGGADLLGIDVGVLAPGRRFDAIAVRVPELTGSRVDDNTSAERLVRLTQKADIDRVWVDGKLVVSSSQSG